jgi:hypothetical protein
VQARVGSAGIADHSVEVIDLGTDVLVATNVTVDASGFVGALSPADDTVAKVAATLDAYSYSLTAPLATFLFGDGGVPVAVNNWAEVLIPVACTLTGWELSIEQAVDATHVLTVGLWRATRAQYDGGITHPVVGDSITATHDPTETNAYGAYSADLSLWAHVALAAGDRVRANVSAATDILRAQLVLYGTRAVVN